ncbi:hypothetical protein MKY96_33710 [Paenibacillus sp. FSL R7-0302]|uniref:hypothetical protein n=1 Tax=Paenibacillus sp. FSL R7-0302 TaxID=2921681 RepID=UPI0030FB9667
MDNAVIHQQQQCILNGSQQQMKQSHDMYNIQVTMQSCLDAGAPQDLLRQIIAMYRRHHAGDKEMQSVINDVEVRYITSLEGYAP